MSVGPWQLFLIAFVAMIVWLIVRAGGKKRHQQKRIADALEDVAKSKKDSEKNK